MGKSRWRPSRRVLWTALAALAVLAVDFATKRAVQQSLELGDPHDIVPGWLVLTHIENTGAAYGLLAGQRWLLVISAGSIAILTPFLLRALPTHGRFAWAGPPITGMILGGALGNLLQRAVDGYVTDFIQTPPIALFQVFNVADAAISVAIAGLVMISLFGDDKALDGAAPAAPATDAPEPEPPAAPLVEETGTAEPPSFEPEGGIWQAVDPRFLLGPDEVAEQSAAADGALLVVERAAFSRNGAEPLPEPAERPAEPLIR